MAPSLLSLGTKPILVQIRSRINLQVTNIKINSNKKLSIAAILAAVTYSSWPLGYIFNSSASKSALASALEGLHQPYNWVFISLDIISSALVIYIAVNLWQKYKLSKQSFILTYIVSNLVIFVLGTLVDALLPEKCMPGTLNCPSWRVDHLLFIHGIFSIVSAISLFLILLIIWWRNRTSLFNLLILGYIIFAMLTLYEAVYPASSNFSQHYYLTLCGLWIAVIPYSVSRTYFDDVSSEFSKKSILESSAGKKPLG